jgi:hypothetical protein
VKLHLAYSPEPVSITVFDTRPDLEDYVSSSLQGIEYKDPSYTVKTVKSLADRCGYCARAGPGESSLQSQHLAAGRGARPSNGSILVIYVRHPGVSTVNAYEAVLFITNQSRFSGSKRD